MGGLRGYCAGWNKSDKDKCQMVSLYVESKKQNKWASRIETDSEIPKTFWQLPDGSGLGTGWKKKDIEKH